MVLKNNKAVASIIIACLALAVVITYLSRAKAPEGLEVIKPGVMYQMKCTSPECGHLYEIDRKDYFAFIKDNAQMSAVVPPMQCPACKEKSAIRAFTCPECDKLFLVNQARSQAYEDKCPYCGFSATEAERLSRK